MTIASHSPRTGLKPRRTGALALATLLLAPLLLAGCSHPRAVYYAPPPPPSYSAVQQHGFGDGVAAARRDLHRGLAPDVNRHPRFRRPPVPPPLMGAYRQGFGEGYGRAMHPVPPPGA